MASQFLAPISRSAQAPALPSVFSTFRSLQQGMDTMLANMLRGAGQGDGSGIAQLVSAPRMDVEVAVEDNLLVISGEKREEHEREAGNRRIVEREFGRFRRALQLPFSPDPERVQAEIRDGLLTVHIPKQEDGRTRACRIEVRRQNEDSGQRQQQGSGERTASTQDAGSRQPGGAQDASAPQSEEKAVETEAA